ESPSKTATTVFTSTVSPSLNLTSVRVPAAGDGISASTLSVEISKSGSSRSTRSPTFLSHFVIVPSAMDSPICGITTSVLIFSPHRGTLLLPRRIVKSKKLSEIQDFRSQNHKTSVSSELPRCIQYVFCLRQVIILQRRRIRHRGIDRGNSHHRSIKPFESLFSDDGSDF